MKLPYEILVEGFFAEKNVKIEWSLDTMKKTRETEQFIETTWAARTANARQNNQLLYSGNLCRLVNWQESKGELTLTLGQTTYKELVGTNIGHPEIAKIFGAEYLSNGTAVCSVVVTADRKLLIQQRNYRVIEHPNMYHVCGGNLELSGHTGCLNPFFIMKKELQEELLIKQKYVVDMYCLGLIRDSFTLKPEIIFETRLHVPSAHFNQNPGPEHRQLLFINESPSDLLRFLTSNFSRFVPVGLACLVVYCKRIFGKQWYEDFLSSLGSTNW